MSGRKRKRFYCDYRDLEEYKAGMWRRVSGKEERANYVERAMAYLKSSERFREGMRRVLREWETSCLYNMTNPGMNKPVWLAHAAAALEEQIPEEFMRLGYCSLSQADKDRADRDAQEICAEWLDPREGAHA